MHALLARRHWIFDMDGTLTLAMHDFAAFKRAEGLPADRPILEHLATLPAPAAAAAHRALRLWELELAAGAKAAPDAVPLVEHLHRSGHRLGVLTRNTREGAVLTLRAAGLEAFFQAEVVLGRDCAPAKPDPAGVQSILDAWGADSADAVMVGDYLFDVLAGQGAGTATVLVDRNGGDPFPGVADVVVSRLDQLLHP